MKCTRNDSRVAGSLIIESAHSSRVESGSESDRSVSQICQAAPYGAPGSAKGHIVGMIRSCVQVRSVDRKLPVVATGYWEISHRFRIRRLGPTPSLSSGFIARQICAGSLTAKIREMTAIERTTKGALAHALRAPGSGDNLEFIVSLWGAHRDID
jgi:hypothetical protein